MTEQILINLLRDRLSAGGNPERLDLTGTPFTHIRSYDYNDGQSGAPFKVFQLGTAGETLPEIYGRFWEIVAMGPGYYPPHIHNRSSAQLIFAAGEGEAFIDRRSAVFNAATSFNVPAGMSHGFSMERPCLMLSVQSGRPNVDPRTGEKDVEPDNEFVLTGI